MVREGEGVQHDGSRGLALGSYGDSQRYGKTFRVAVGCDERGDLCATHDVRLIEPAFGFADPAADCRVADGGHAVPAELVRACRSGSRRATSTTRPVSKLSWLRAIASPTSTVSSSFMARPSTASRAR